jgi:RHS repeat-associated protein
LGRQEEYAPAGVLAATYVRGLDLLFQDRGAARSFYVKDGSGSTRALTNASGAVTDIYTYDGFGDLISRTGSTVNNYLFTGQWWDGSLGLYNLRARDYAPMTGRFLSRDMFQAVLLMPLTLNRFTYANNDPVNLTDPSGLIAGISPYEVEAQIQPLYWLDHLGQRFVFGQWTRLTPLIPLPPGVPDLFRAKPDILNYTLKTYNEIKPLSFSGVAEAIAQMALRKIQFVGLGYNPDIVWPMSLANPANVRFIFVGSQLLIFFNAGGVLFYSDILDLVRYGVVGTVTYLSFEAVRNILRDPRFFQQFVNAPVRAALSSTAPSWSCEGDWKQ